MNIFDINKKQRYIVCTRVFNPIHIEIGKSITFSILETLNKKLRYNHQLNSSVDLFSYNSIIISFNNTNGES